MCAPAPKPSSAALAAGRHPAVLLTSCDRIPHADEAEQADARAFNSEYYRRAVLK